MQSFFCHSVDSEFELIKVIAFSNLRSIRASLSLTDIKLCFLAQEINLTLIQNHLKALLLSKVKPVKYLKQKHSHGIIAESH